MTREILAELRDRVGRFRQAPELPNLVGGPGGNVTGSAWAEEIHQDWLGQKPASS